MASGKGQQPRARCLFCGAEGVTKEHVLAKSLTELFELETPEGFDAVIRHEYEHPEDGVPARIKRAKTMAYVARKFCKPCNGGWMSLADEAVRPILAAFATNEPMTLTPAEQQALTFWVTKTLLGFLSVEPEEYRFAVPELYHELYETRAPLAGSQVWLGANEHGHIAWQRAHSLTFAHAPQETRGLGASLSFGYGVLHFMYHGNEQWQLHLRHDAQRSLRRIWPVQAAVKWPAPLLIAGPDLTSLPLLVNANSAFARRAPPK